MIADATADLDVGFLVYCAGADPDFKPFLANPVSTAEAMIQRNCTVPVQLATTSLRRWSSGAVAASSSSVRAQVSSARPNMVAYGATKAFDMVFAEALWSELHDKGVDVLGLILGKTDTPALRDWKRERGSSWPRTSVAGRGHRRRRRRRGVREPRPTADRIWSARTMRAGMQMLTSLPRNDAVR